MKHRLIGKVTCSVVLATLSIAASMTAAAASREKDPMWQQLTEIDGRVLRIERVINNNSLLDMAQRNDELQQQLRQLRGQLEELQHSVDTARNQFRDAVADLDKRVQALEAGKGAGASSSAPDGGPVNTGSSAGGGSTADRDAYQAAFGLLKDGKYSEATTAFTQFMSAYPQSTLLDNAQYWLGEAHYVGKDYTLAARDFQSVLSKYPNSAKAPDAMLKLGYTQYEMKDYKAARSTLTKLTTQYADSKAAVLAQQRIAKMNAEGL
ncbi:MAG TPA: tol-pal system protein YbgF [Steroidobacteraceae bacterium]|nr:tol-pal system protein YbgF [Steroidobacteraceae bacterium]